MPKPGGDPTSYRTGGDAIVETLLAWGVRRVFTCPGTTEVAFLDATLDSPELQIVLTPHESVAVAAADGYARASGEPAVAYLHTHVGLSNGLPHLYAASLAHSPVVVLNGLKPALILAHGGFTALPDTGRLAAPFVKRTWQSLTADGIPADVGRALQVATSGPTGPTWVGLSQDLVSAECAAPVTPPERYRPRARTAPDPERIGAAAALLGRARRPVLVAGGDVGRHGGAGELAALAEKLGAPVMHEEQRGFERVAVRGDHPHYAGFYSADRASVQDSDLLVFLGCRCFHEFDVPARPDVPPGVETVHTHTDPALVGAVYGTDVDVVGDEQLVIAALLAALPEGGPSAADRAGHLEAARAEHAANRARPFQDAPEGYTTVDRVAAALAEVVDADTTVVDDATTSAGALLRALTLTEDQWFGTSSGSLGWGTAAALGVKLARPDRHVVVVAGDGAFQFGPQAVWVSAHYQIPVTYVVVNNGSYAAVADGLRRYGGRAAARGSYPGADISGIDIATVARGYGATAERIHDTSELGALVTKARRSPGPTLIEVMTDPDALPVR
jgi:benzoylformate decarboxylase